ncbi:MAG: 16S rRNA (cytosine(1402)-N(4))-methyltransferase RsmH [Streptosporangiaceae bacterium]
MGAMNMAAAHLPVMPERVRAILAPALGAPGAVLVDATLGRAGHTRALLGDHPGLSVIGIDADEAAIEESRQLLAAELNRVRLVQASYDQIAAILADLGRDTVQGVLFDLGVSSPQLDDPGRGFSYAQDAPLDMRMDQSGQLTAADVVNTYPVDRLARVLRDYGEERFARRIADAVVRERSRQPISSTLRLADLVKSAIPAAARRTGGNPAKRTFQALRIEVNDELGALRRAVPAALDAVAVGGRIVALSYHSLEDRIVKRALSERSRDTTPPGMPVSLPGNRPQFRLLTSGAERPDDTELAANPRAASARLRAAERVLAIAEGSTGSMGAVPPGPAAA